MKSAVRLAFLVASLWAAVLCDAPAASTTSSRLERVYVYGVEYVRLEDWARSVGGQVRWSVPKREVTVALPSGTLRFSVDQRRCAVKGVEVSMSAPVAYRGSSALICAADVSSTLLPILSPAKNPPGRGIKTIVLDAGHGGKDPGNQESRRQEKQYTLLLARELSELLTKAGFKVSLTRSSDVYLSPEERPEIARRRGADLFISLHFNSADGRGASSVEGAETFCMTLPRTSSTNARGEGAETGSRAGNRNDARNVLLAYQIQKALVQKAGCEDRGVKRARFAVLREATMPAVLIEAAFMTHGTDAKRIYDSAQRRRLAQAIADGTIAYRNIVEGVRPAK